MRNITILTAILFISLSSCKKENTNPSRGDVMFYKTSSTLGRIALEVTWRGITAYDTLNYYFSNGRSTCLPFTDNTGSLNFEGFYYVDSITTPEYFNYSAHTLNNSRNWSGQIKLSNSMGEFICYPVVLN